MKKSAIATISLYGSVPFGKGHITDGRPAIKTDEYKISIQESLTLFDRLLEDFVIENKLLTGQKIRIILEETKNEF